MNIEISCIVVGLTPHKDEAKKSVEALLNRYGVKYGEVVPSKIPYRNGKNRKCGKLGTGRRTGRSLPVGVR